MDDTIHVRHVLIKISDPWSLGIQLNWRAIPASIVAGNDFSVLIKLDTPFDYNGIVCEYLVASPRHEGDQITNLQKGKSVFCCMTRISSEQAQSGNPMDISKWRGGLAIIGELEEI